MLCVSVARLVVLKLKSCVMCVCGQVGHLEAGIMCIMHVCSQAGCPAAEMMCITCAHSHAGSPVARMIIIMYIYRALINALSAHIVHINLNTIFCTHVERGMMRRHVR